jgi:two-component system, sensor histidine kinase YesM
MHIQNLKRLILFVKSKLLVKLVFVYSGIMLIPLLITTYMVTESINSKLFDLEIRSHKEITNNMKAYLNEQNNKINGAIYQLYHAPDDSASPVDKLVQLNRQEIDYSYQIKKEISNYLDRVVINDDELLDIILFDNKRLPNAYTTSNRSISNSYDFSKIRPIALLEFTDRHTKTFPDKRPDYILNGNSPVLTYYGNLYDMNALTSLSPVGKYIINISLSKILSKYRQLAGSNQSTFYIIREDGLILFSSSSQEIGRKYPFFKTITSSNKNEMKLEEKSYIINKTLLTEMGFHLVIQTPKELITENTKQLTKYIFTLFLIAFFIILILSFLFSSNIANKIKKLHSAMNSMENGNFDTIIENKSKDELGLLTVSFNKMSSRLKEYVDKVYIAEIKSKSAELSLLHSAINPHFFYNTIESIRMKAVEEHSREISQMLYVFGRLFQWRISNNQSIITIEEEIDSINWFIDLIEYRFQENFVAKIVIDQSIYEFGIPKLLLQPIIENAVQHGLFHKSQKSFLLIRGYKCNQRIIFEIIDNGIGMDETQIREIYDKFEGNAPTNDSKHIGLTNVMRRIKVMFGDSYKVEIKSQKNHWTKVCITLPAFTRKEMEENVQGFYR